MKTKHLQGHQPHGRKKRSFIANENILGLLREATGQETNDQLAIQISYDLQAGSYLQALEDPEYIDFKGRVCREMAGVISGFAPASVLEAGVGEATSLAGVIRNFPEGSATSFSGFDLSWSRCHYARQYLRQQLGSDIPIFVAGLESIPLVSNSVDVVYTAHAIEPNHGREREILRELYRVAQRYVVLFEPAYEFTTDEIRGRMEQHGYCRGLAAVAREEGWNVITHRMADVQYPPNPTALLVIEKSTERQPAKTGFGCPLCQGPLIAAHGQHFCESEGVAYPSLRGIPCLLPLHAIVANKFLVDFPDDDPGSR